MSPMSLRALFVSLLASSAALAGSPDAGSPSCSDAELKAAALTAIRSFCAGTKDGCELTVRRDPLLVVAWRIHGWHESGKPKFVPDANRLVHFDASCRVVKVNAHIREVPIER